MTITVSQGLLIAFMAFIAVANGPRGCSSFHVQSTSRSDLSPRSLAVASPASKIIFITDRFSTSTKLLMSTSVMPSEEELLAAVEDGSIDIEDLKEMFGEDFDFDNEDNDEEYDEDFDDEYDEDYDEEVEDEVEEENKDEDDQEEVLDYLEEEYDDEFEEEDSDNEVEVEAMDNLEHGGHLEANQEIDEDEEEKEEVNYDNELLMQFVDHFRETPLGELETGDAELVHEVLRNFPLETIDSEEYPDSKKPSYVVESLLNRLTDEWRDSVLLLEGNDEHDSDTPMEELEEREQLFRPIADDFHHVMVAIYEDGQSDDSVAMKATRMWKLLSDQRELVSFFRDNDDELAAESLYPTLRSIELVLDVLSSSSERAVDRKASIVVEEWLPDYGLIPNPEVYGPYIQMIAKARHRGAARKAENILRNAVREYPPNDYESPIGVEVFNAVVTAYAKARGESHGPERAQNLIVFMDTLGKPGCAPNAKTFTSLVDAYAQVNEWDSISEAQSILNNLLNQFLSDGDGKHLEPSVATWTIVIAAWMRLSRKGRTGAAKRAGDLLRRMESLASAGRITAKPDAITYVTVFNAYASSKFRDEIEKAEELLDEMNEMYLDGDDSFRPSVPSIKALMESWIKVGDLFQAEEVLKKYQGALEEAEDDESGEIRHSMTGRDWEDIYKSLLNGHARSDNPRRATEYLNLMIENDDMEPSSLCYEKIIEAYARLGEEDCGQKTQELFQLLEKRRQLGAVSVNERVYTSIIRALTKAKVPGLHKKAYLVVQRMRSLAEEGHSEVEPNIFTYNAVLNACSECIRLDDSSHQEAFQTSVRVFTELREMTTPDHVTFGNMIKCSNLLSAESQQETKEKFIISTFKLCCESGNVNNYLIRDLSRAASVDLWVKLTRFSPDLKEKAAADVDVATRLVTELPPSWRRR